MPIPSKNRPQQIIVYLVPHSGSIDQTDPSTPPRNPDGFEARLALTKENQRTERGQGLIPKKEEY